MIRIKPHKQKPGFCGPASLKMILHFHGVEMSEDELGNITMCVPEHGVNGAAIVKAAKELGFHSMIKDAAELADIIMYYEQGLPVIVEWFSADESHFSVVVKIDEKYIYLQDPELADIRRIELVAFERIWFGFDTDVMRTKRDLVLRRLIVIEKRMVTTYPH